MKNIILALVGIVLTCTSCSKRTNTLYVYSWADYFDPEMISKFEHDNDCTVVIDTFDSNESMYTKLKAGAAGYDVITPSSYQIQLMLKDGMLAQIDHSLLPNVSSNFNHELDSQVLDKDMKWSVPYACTYTGLMCCSNDAYSVKSWKDISNPMLKGKVSLLDDIREVLAIGLFHNGHSLNSTNRQEIFEAAETVIGWKGNVRKFDSESYKLEVANRSTWVGHGYSADTAQVIIGDERDDLTFVLPDEGFTIAWDEFVISSRTENYELAHRFIDFFYDDDNAYRNMTYIWSLMANKNAIEKIDGQHRWVLLPDNIDKGQLLRGFDDDEVYRHYNDAWDMLKSTK